MTGIMSLAMLPQRKMQSLKLLTCLVSNTLMSGDQSSASLQGFTKLCAACSSSQLGGE